MFKKFAEFYGLSNNASPIDEKEITDLMKNTVGFVDFMSKFQGTVFGKGEYRIHKLSDIQKWNKLVSDLFPHTNGFECFGSDWLGRQFALYENKLKMFDVETNQVYSMDYSFVDFHNQCIVENVNDCFTMDYYNLWLNEYNLKLAGNQCVGYKVPLILNGIDSLENFEVKDMETYWTEHKKHWKIWLD